MLRSRSVSPCHHLRSVVSAVIVLVTLLVASRALARPAVVVVGPDGSARAQAIAAELRARGLDVVTDARDKTPDVPVARVEVDEDGAVRVVAGPPSGPELRESFAASEGDAVLARRVAEMIRAATDATESAAKSLPPSSPPPPPEPPSTPPPPPPPTRRAATAPARSFATAGTWLLSIDDAVPIYAVGGLGPLGRGTATRIGDATYGVMTSPKPFSVDVAIFNRLTLGGTLITQIGPTTSVGGGAIRAGYVFPLSDRIAFWPRLGFAHAESFKDEDDTLLELRTDLVADARLVWTISDACALTVGPSLALNLAPGSQGGGITRFDEARASFNTFRGTVQPRLGLSIGITGRISERPEDHGTDERAPRFFLGMERIAPLFRYRMDIASTGGKDGTDQTLADTGTADVTPIAPQTPRIAFDVRVGRLATVGVAGSIGITQLAELADGLSPASSAPETFAWVVAPRVGLRAVVSKSFALWPRLGLTYAYASTSRTVGDTEAYHLGADLDGFAVFYPVPGVGFLLGPTLEFPIAGVSRISKPGDARNLVASKIDRTEHEFITLALSAGLVLELP